MPVATAKNGLRFGVLLLLAALLMVARPASAAPGDLDPAFGSGGIVRTSFGRVAEAHAVTTQSDGRLVVAGKTRGDGDAFAFALARYSSSGVLDRGFGTDGRVVTPIGSGDASANAVGQQADGKLVAVGYASNGVDNDFAFARYNLDGSPDRSFGDQGIAIVPIGGRNDIARSVVFDSQRRIIVVGSTVDGDSNDIVLARLTTNGALDATFGSGGIAVAPGVHANDALYVTIGIGDRVTVTALSGTLQQTFAYSTGGFVFDESVTLTTGLSQTFGFLEWPDYAFVITGAIDGRFAVTWLKGYEPLASFGVNGIATVDFGGDDSAAYGAIRTAGDRLTAVGRAGDDFAVVRFFGTPLGSSAAPAPVATNPIPPAGRTLATNTFDDPATGAMNPGGGEYRDGEYVFSFGPAAARSFEFATVQGTYGDASLAVDARFTRDADGSGISLWCRYTEGNPSSGYTANIQTAPFPSFTVDRLGDRSRIVLARGVNGAIRSGVQTNHLELICAGSTIAFVVNGMVLASVDDTSYSSGVMRLQMEGVGSPEARFDNLVVAERTPAP